ncbi:hypothetical protein DJ568_04165 [Mucilaginibacter hurinus]|uniref:2'-5' RNA ligase family protein n=1 Tax=Mucilaginibacter hurinus TaxID=2201324 RepID=A0A367GS85_9SPHI|nr:hypothetical protein [Mucilaginibacter hurinus]RCH55955.1 hypothetical protein DJ568_04165 [Mucilaginibacter hurinus]
MHYAQYRFLFSPPQHVKDKIKEYKQVSIDKIGTFDSMHSTAYISIPFDEGRQKTFVLEPALIRMEKSLNSMPPIKLDIVGFDAFANHVTGYTIYAAFDINDKVKNWIKLLFRSMNMKQQSFKPHITIARNIPEESYRVLWHGL